MRRMTHNSQTHRELQGHPIDAASMGCPQSPTDAPLVRSSEAESFNATSSGHTLSSPCTSEVGIADDKKSASIIDKAHPVFVLDSTDRPLTPTTYAHAQKLIRHKKATRIWSKFGFWGVKLHIEVKIPITEKTCVSHDAGTKFEGYSVVSGNENPLNVKLDLPCKKKVVRKLEERTTLRRAKRHRKCRRRPARFDNRKREGFIAPSQNVIVQSRIKVLEELCRIYPVGLAAIEDVKFNHAARRWGANFSTVEIGKSLIRKFFSDRGINLIEFEGWETKELRERYSYRKTKDKAANRFESHCSDSLSLAVDVTTGEYITPGRFIVVDDTYRPVRRRLHDTQPAKGGVREKYSRGTVFGVRKGKIVGVGNQVGMLCGEYKGKYRYYDKRGKRQSTGKLHWISNQFRIVTVGASGRVAPHSPAS